jgi:hypothetical protein
MLAGSVFAAPFVVAAGSDGDGAAALFAVALSAHVALGGVTVSALVESFSASCLSMEVSNSPWTNRSPWPVTNRLRNWEARR